jgi:D-beta-D-heptose 7-phosphate kinase/D-beta-D-heptose 1-phosphate adenosyltransferase
VTAPGTLDEAAFGRALSAFSSLRALVVGDVMLDRTVEGSVLRLSPEAPVPVLRAERESVGLGGAANVANQLVAFGASVSLCGVVGDDVAGGELRRLCAERGIDAHLAVDTGRPTTQKARYLAHEHYMLRVDTERPAPLGDPLERELAAWVGSVARPDVVVLSDHDMGVLGTELVRAVLAAAARWGAPVLTDPKGDDLDRYRGSTIIKANQREFEALVGGPLGADPVVGVEAARARLVETTGCEGLVVTLGGSGMVVASGADPAVAVPADPVHPADVSGAGDTVIAAMALSLASGLDLLGAARVANVAAGIAVSRSGVEVISLADLGGRLAGARLARVHSRDELLGRVALWRTAGCRVALTNGCFDLLHGGHLELLRAAAADADVLVVAVDTDESVRELKGPGRPIVAEDERAELVAAIDDVDAVVLFHHRDLADLVAAIAPDRLVKGADYAGAEVVGRASVEAAGGEVSLAPLRPHRSTSGIIERIRGGTGTTPPVSPPGSS